MFEKCPRGDPLLLSTKETQGVSAEQHTFTHGRQNWWGLKTDIDDWVYVQNEMPQVSSDSDMVIMLTHGDRG